jgi:hypothetical protein
MLLNFIRLASILKSGCIVLFFYLLSTQTAVSQQVSDWDKAALKDSVTALLSNYQILHNQLTGQADSSVVWRFMHLFPNPRVQVINEIEEPGKGGKISIEEFIVKLADLFPDGLSLKMDLARLSMDPPKYDRNNRYIIRVRLRRSLSGISGGKVISSDQKVIFQIAFFYNDNAPGNFTIYGMDLPPKGQSYMNATLSPAYTGFVNSTLKADNRLVTSSGAGYKGGISFTHFYSDNWGVGTGAQFSQYSGTVTLDSFDAIGGFNPNLSDVAIKNDLWFVEIPVYLSARTNLSNRFELRADVGFSFGFRVFENMISSAVNDYTGLTQSNVLSDANWINEMNRVNVGLQGNISLGYQLGSRTGIFLGCGIRQGLSGLDSNIQSDYSSTKYLGQYNPLWGAPGKTVNQAFFVNLGASFRINKEMGK